MTDTVRKMPAWRTAGFWLAALMAAMQALNAARVSADPVGFAAYMGLPLADPADVGFVYVYGLRAAFVAALVAILLSRRQLAALAWIALAAVLMPMGDAWLTWRAEAPPAVVLRHLLIGAYLVVSFLALRRAAGRAS